MEFVVYLNEDTSSFLSKLVAVDQSERNAWEKFVLVNGGWANIDSARDTWIKKKNRKADDIFNDKPCQQQLIDKAKSFDFAKFTEQDWDNFWLIAQHCDHDRAFQKWAKDIVLRYEGKDSSHYKYLSDRIQMSATGEQTYGTQND